MPAGDPIALLLAGRYPDPETGELLTAAARAVAIEDSLAGREVELVEPLGLGPHLALIADRTTYDVLGRRVEAALAKQYTVQPIVLDDHPHVDRPTVAALVAALDPRTDAVVAVGSGTINDLSKLVAVERSCPQVVFATAPSMNGYTSLNASILDHGLKRSVRAAVPVGVFCDLSILAAAPIRLIRAGLGDSLCRSTAQADWLLAHFLREIPYREVPFALLAGDEPQLIASAPALVAGDLAAMRHLVRTLILSGFGMTICGGSYPASQGEHLISHYIDMMRPPHLAEAFHGEQIAVASIAMARLQDPILAREHPPVLGPTQIDRAAVVAHFGETHGELCWRELERKRLDRAAADAINHRLAERWPAIRDRIAGIALGATRMCDTLRSAGVATAPQELGWPSVLFDAALAHARELRDRYTFLDLAGDLVG